MQDNKMKELTDKEIIELLKRIDCYINHERNIFPFVLLENIGDAITALENRAKQRSVDNNCHCNESFLEIEGRFREAVKAYEYEIENLKCCANCGRQDISGCEQSENKTYKCCKKWFSDGMTINARML